MGPLNFLTRTELEKYGPPTPEELDEVGLSLPLLRDLALKQLAALHSSTAQRVADELRLPCALIDEILYQLYQEELIEMRVPTGNSESQYVMRKQGWKRVTQLKANNGYLGPAPVSLADYSYMMRLQANPNQPATLETVRDAYKDLVLPDSLLNTIGCAINSRTSLFLSGLPGMGKTAVSERINGSLFGSIWIPYAIAVEGVIIRIFDEDCHKPVREKNELRDHRWIPIERPLVMAGTELTLEHTDLAWSESGRFYEAPVQLKANCGTLVIDDFGRQRSQTRELFNRWIMPLERRMDYLTLRSGKKIEVPFEELVLFATNLDEDWPIDEAFLRRMGYRAHLESPTTEAYIEIFNRVAIDRKMKVTQTSLNHLLKKYTHEKRSFRSCEPRDLANRVVDICKFRGCEPELTPELIDLAWNVYFGKVPRLALRSDVGTIAEAAAS
jgi:hypothetical protein